MLNKNIDIFIVGENYLSYLMADRYLKKNKSVLILNSSKQVMNTKHFKELGTLEYTFLRKWVRDLCPNFSLNDFILSRPYYLRMNNKELMLGHDSIYQNLLEVSRKFPKVLSFDLLKNEILESEKGLEGFEIDCRNFLEQLGDSLYSYHNIQNFSLDLLMKDCPKDILTLFDFFFQNVTNLTKGSHFNEIDLLLFSLRSKFQSFSSHKFSKLELFHLFMSLISPSYELDESSLLVELRNNYVSHGGFYRNASIRNVKYDKGRPWCVELSSFEGVVHPGRLVFIGGGPRDLPVSIKKYNFFTEIRGKLNTQFKYFKSNRVDLFDSRMVGTDFSSWSYSTGDGSDLNISFMTKYNDALKEHFVRDEFDHILKSFFGLKRVEVSSLEFSDNISSYSYQRNDNAISPVHFVDKTPLGSKFSSLKAVDSLGPLKASGLGVLSSLMEAKDYHLFYS